MPSNHRMNLRFSSLEILSSSKCAFSLHSSISPEVICVEINKWLDLLIRRKRLNDRWKKEIRCGGWMKGGREFLTLSYEHRWIGLAITGKCCLRSDLLYELKQNLRQISIFLWSVFIILLTIYQYFSRFELQYPMQNLAIFLLTRKSFDVNRLHLVKKLQIASVGKILLILTFHSDKTSCIQFNCFSRLRSFSDNSSWNLK